MYGTRWIAVVPHARRNAERARVLHARPELDRIGARAGRDLEVHAEVGRVVHALALGGHAVVVVLRDREAPLLDGGDLAVREDVRDVVRVLIPDLARAHPLVVRVAVDEHAVPRRHALFGVLRAVEAGVQVIAVVRDDDELGVVVAVLRVLAPLDRDL